LRDTRNRGKDFGDFITLKLMKIPESTMSK
jgi:hypothetical protein